jgi:ferritin-like metal-binding protein YciE
MTMNYTSIADVTPTASPEVQRERILGYIDDAIAVESAAITSLKDMLEDARESEDAILYRDHLAETESQKARLEARLNALGGKSSRNVFKDLINKVGAAATDILHAAHTPHEKATRNLIQAYAVENLEVAVYEALYHAAHEVGDSETADLAKAIQAEEKAAAEKIWRRLGESSRVGIKAAQ